MGHFWTQVILRAFWDSVYGIGQSGEGILYALTVILITVVVLVRKQGWAWMRRHVWNTLGEGALVAILAWGLFFVVHLVRAPYLLWADENFRATRAEEERNAAIKKLAAASNKTDSSDAERARRKAIREKLGQFVNEGSALRDRAILDVVSPKLQADWRRWTVKVERFLRENMDASYEARFKTMNIGGYPLSETIMNEIKALDDFLMQLKD